MLGFWVDLGDELEEVQGLMEALMWSGKKRGRNWFLQWKVEGIWALGILWIPCSLSDDQRGIGGGEVLRL